MIKKSHRHTIQDGRVVTFALDFREEDGILGPIDRAIGPFSVSASRNKVMVHRANIINVTGLEIFQKTLKIAWKERIKLRKCGGRPDDGWDGSPKEIEVKNDT